MSVILNETGESRSSNPRLGSDSGRIRSVGSNCAKSAASVVSDRTHFFHTANGKKKAHLLIDEHFDCSCSNRNYVYVPFHACAFVCFPYIATCHIVSHL